MAKKKIPLHEVGTRNVFADLGFPNPEKELLKAHLTLALYKIIKQRGYTQKEAADVLGIDQPKVSLLMNNRAGSFSVNKLMDFLTCLDQDIEIRVHPKTGKQAQITVHPA
jgi:predicted XRE-type DNA-binding protein